MILPTPASSPRSSGNRFHVTPAPPVRAIRRDSVRRSLRRGNRWPDVDPKRLDHAVPDFVPAGDLKAGDLVVFPINQVEHDDATLSDDFLRLLGYYVAEGCATMFNGCKAVEICFGDHEQELADDVSALIARITGKRPSRTHDRKRHGIYLVVYSDDLWDRLVEHGGKYAAGKNFSKAGMDLPPARPEPAVD